MDFHSILDNSPSQAGPEPAPPTLVPSDVTAESHAPLNLVATDLVSETPAAEKVGPVARDTLRFPGEDGGKSLSEMAQRDLDATLQLLAERAQYITGASGAAVALRQGEIMICCASSGSSAPGLGAHLQIDSGLSAESVKTRQVLHCDDAENDPRVNRDSCRAFGIASVVVMPLVRGEEVYGVFELLSSRPRAFEERDFLALNRLAEMIQTAVEHSEAAKRAETELAQPEVAAVAAEAEPTESGTESRLDKVVGDSDETSPEPEQKLAAGEVGTTEHDISLTSVVDPALPEAHAPAVDIQEAQVEANLGSSTTIAFGNLRSCETCGFPVSEGRRLCLDCEAATPDAVDSVIDAPGDLAEEANPSWLRSHVYLIASLVIAAATIVLLVWRS